MSTGAEWTLTQPARLMTGVSQLLSKRHINLAFTARHNALEDAGLWLIWLDTHGTRAAPAVCRKPRTSSGPIYRAPSAVGRVPPFGREEKFLRSIRCTSNSLSLHQQPAAIFTLNTAHSFPIFRIRISIITQEPSIYSSILNQYIAQRLSLSG